MTTTFVTADLHFGHASVCTTFKNSDGSPLRPFADPDEMNIVLIRRWNEIVDVNDTVYVLGDVCMSHRHLHHIGRCNGRKVLIQGNHDPVGGKRGKNFNFNDYFDYVTAHKVVSGIIMTHIPLHPGSVSRFGTNVHGHLHGTEVMRSIGYKSVPDSRYLCVSVEQTDFRPLSLEEVRERIDQRRKEYGSPSTDS